MVKNVTEALITGAVAIIVCMINNHFQNKASQKQNEMQSDKTAALIDYKLSELTKRVDKHNNVIERTYRLEELAAVQGEQIKVANHRIQDLEVKNEK